MTEHEQLERWVNGDPVHDDEHGQCCPDFSCCKPELLISKDRRESFRDADDRNRKNMLMEFLSAAVNLAQTEKTASLGTPGKTIYVTDGESNRIIEGHDVARTIPQKTYAVTYDGEFQFYCRSDTPERLRQFLNYKRGWVQDKIELREEKIHE